MIFLYLLLIGTGALPLVVFLVKRKRYYHILREGAKTTAEVTEVRTIRYQKGATYDKVFFAYLPPGAGRYFPGEFITKIGKHRRGDRFEIHYLSRQPQKYAVPGSKSEVFMFLFVLLIFAFVVFACFKIDEAVNVEGVRYEFKPPWKN
ncbi:hypothetical protein HRG84_03235 [Flavisolibacter sp. BT320]|nr:hypothetical protein [Flavisolibacter longurius]